MKVNDDERERRIRELMDFSGFSRGQAEFAVAIELGEMEGDVRILDDRGDKARDQ